MRGEDSSVILDERCNSKFNLIFHSFLFCQNHHTKKNLLQLIDLHLEVKMSLFPWWEWINLSHGKCHQSNGIASVSKFTRSNRTWDFI